MKEAMLFSRLEGNRVHCFLCSQHCHIEPGQRGKCGVRENIGGTLFTLVYGVLVAQNVDPVEKKPLFHFYPGSRSYSIATSGCNFECLFCQNADISQSPRALGEIYGIDASPSDVVDKAVRNGCASLSYTYTEPTIFMEFALDVSMKSHERGLKNVFVSNGYMTRECMESISPWMDAANVDLKAFSDKFYQEQCGARLKPVLQTLEDMKKRGIWLEVTTLLIPGLNDDPAELRELAAFIVSLGPETPWHVSRFHPTYRLTDRPPTPVSRLREARQIGMDAGLYYVYTGNVPGDDGESTYCHKCGALLIERKGFSSRPRGLSNGVCSGCGAQMEGKGLHWSLEEDH